MKDSILLPLEQVVDNLKIEIFEEDINTKVCDYIYKFFNKDIGFDNNILIGDYLTSKLNDIYLSKRGKRKDLNQISNDIDNYFKDLDIYNINKKRLTLFRNRSWNSYDITCVAIFENISV